jgi:alpha-beta hydrolase superfamily lysophospholipase
MAFKIPHIKKSEYGVDKFYKERARYYLYGFGMGVGLITDAILRSRNPYEAGLGYVIIGNSMLGYAGDFKHQISLKKGFKARKIYTFGDGTKILADSEKNAQKVYELHQHHKTHPHHFSLIHSGVRK